MRSRILPRLWLSCALALGGCTAPAPTPVLALPAELDPNVFHGSNAWTHVEALAAIGPREAATEGSAKARAYITGELQALGLEVVEQTVSAKRANGDALTLRNVGAAVPGESTDLILVLAPYDTRGFDSFENLGVNDGASGVAVNLELARLIAASPLPYTTWFVFLEGEQQGRGAEESAHVGTRGLVGLLEQRKSVEQVRLALMVNRVCDPDLHIARDLGSHRVYREAFFSAAKRLGLTAAFDARAGFESPAEGQNALAFAGLSRVVVLADTSFGGTEPPGPYADTADDDLEHCAAESLETVGQVAHEGVHVITRRLRRIDRFSDSPIAETEAMRLEHLAETAPASEPGADAAPDGAAPDVQGAPDAQDAPDVQGAPDAQATPDVPGAPDAQAASDASADPAPPATGEDAPAPTEPAASEADAAKAQVP